MSGMRCLALLAVVAAAGMSVVAGTRRLRETNVAEQVHVSFTGVASEYIVRRGQGERKESEREKDTTKDEERAISRQRRRRRRRRRKRAERGR